MSDSEEDFVAKAEFWRLSYLAALAAGRDHPVEWADKAVTDLEEYWRIFQNDKTTAS